MKRWIWIIALAAIAAAGIFLGLRPQPVPVETAAVTTGPLRVTVEEEGKTRLRSRYIVSAPVAGYMPRLRWKAGDTIPSGVIVATLDPPRPVVLDARTRDQSDARVKSAEAALAVAEARVRAQQEQVRVAQSDAEFLRRQRDREETLRKSGDVAAEKLDRTLSELRRVEAATAAAERAVVTARAEVESARADIAAARATLRQVTAGPAAGGERIAIAAPAGGRVIRVIRESEGVVNPGDALIEIGNASALEIVVEVLSADAVRIAPGTRVILMRWGGEKNLEGLVRVIEPGGFTKISALGVEEQRVRVVADITSPESEWKPLGDGYRVEAAFVLWEAPNVLQVPANALFRYQDGWAVFVVEAGFARRRKVQIGHRTGLAVEITAGLRSGETLVAHPDETVDDGKQVAVQPR